ncbi:MAG: tetratricopeptide repeat protein [bacterium]|nr:MAG: tetratricopeptide repeat protein [bacterium]
MSDFCNNEDWLAAYLERGLSEGDRRLYEIHLSQCPRCLAQLISTKTELHEITGSIPIPQKQIPAMSAPHIEGVSGTRPGDTGAPAGAWAWLAGIGKRIVPAPLAPIVGIALAAAFFMLLTDPTWNPEVIAARSGLTHIIEYGSIGTLRLTAGRRNPREIDATLRGSGYSDHSLMERTRKLLRDALERSPRTPEIHTMMGHLYIAGGEAERAEIHYRRALMLRPEDGGILNNLAVAAYRTGDITKALDLLERAQAGKNTPIEVYYNLGVIHLEAGNGSPARHFLELYLSKDRSSPWSTRARSLISSLL